MSRRDAPLFSRADAFARWLIERVRRWPPAALRLLGEPLVAEARAVLGGVALALAQPARRVEHLRAIDEALTRLRVWLALTDDLLAADERQTAAERVAELGRMVGGWRKRAERARAEA